MALSIEAAELNEVFLWKDVKVSKEVDKTKIKEELAYVFAYALLLAEIIAKNTPWIQMLRNILIKQPQKSYYEHHFYR